MARGPQQAAISRTLNLSVLESILSLSSDFRLYPQIYQNIASNLKYSLPTMRLATSKLTTVLLLTLTLQLGAEELKNQPESPPIAERREHVRTFHDLELKDPYFWLKDQSYPEVNDQDILDYLTAENEYFDAWMEPLQPAVEQIFQELKGRLVENEWSVPIKDGSHIYQSRWISGQQYRTHVRWPYEPGEPIFNESDDSRSIEVLIDENELAKGKDYFRLAGPILDPKQELLIYSTDDSGSERFTLKIKHIKEDRLFPETIDNVTGQVVWASDGRSFFYTVLNEDWRPFRVMRHVLGTETSEDTLIYQEEDDGFFVGISRSTSRKVLLVETASHTTSEIHYLWLENPTAELELIAARQDRHMYSADHHRQRFVISTNDDHRNFRLVVAPEETPQREHWQELVPSSDKRYIVSYLPFESRIVIYGRENANQQLYLLNESTSELSALSFPQSAFSVYFGSNVEPDPAFLRIRYSSLITPESVLDYDFSNGEITTRKTQQIPSGYDKSLYKTDRLFATARDAVKVPITVAYRKSTPLDGSAPLYLYGYGAYGASMDPSFRSTILSLLDRGFVFAIAHIRGGSELGFKWYEAGKLEHRKNTFNDFIDVARFLISEKFTAKGRIAIAGGSAGGSLVGVAINEAPQLWGAVAAQVPFVDILNTMLDDSLPLTPIEWPEWGNPILDEEAFRFIRSYSPYDQVIAMGFPPLFVTAGLNDPRVTYWEPAKWVAKIRHLKTDSNPLLFKTEMGAGHGGKSGRYDSLREESEVYAFILEAMDIEP